MSHEKTFDVEFDGLHYLFPTVVGGAEYHPDIVVDMFRKGWINPLGVYNSQDEVARVAKQRSNAANDPIIPRGVLRRNLLKRFEY